MHKFKKISSFLSVLLVLAISVGTFPLSALAQYYTVDDNTGYADYTYSGEIQAPNSNVLSSLGAFGVSLGTLPFSENFPTPPSFSSRANNNWSTSMSSKTFSIVGSDNVGNYCNVSAFSNSSLGLNVSFYDEGTGRITWNTSCSPDVSVETTRNANGSASGRPVAIQTSEVLPLAVFEEDTLVTRVESIQNDPNNVRVTVGVNSTIESYGAQFQRVDGISDWVGHVAIDTEIGRVSLSDVEKSNDAQLPQGVKIAASSPSDSSSTVRPRNSDIVSVTQPRCTWTSDDDWWSGTNWIQDCIAYGLSADGRTGRAEAMSETGRSGGFGEFVGAVVSVVGIAYGGIIGLGTEGFSLNLSLEGFIGSALSTTGVVISSAVAGSVAITVAAMLQSATDGTYGTVEQSIASSVPLGTRNGQWSWAWSELPAQPTVARVCTNGANNSSYPACNICNALETMNSSGVCADPVVNTCQDPSASNNGGPLPCTYPQSTICQDPSASNNGGPLPCTYPKPTTCQDRSANNNGGPLPCTYPQGTVLSLPQSVTVRVCSGNTPTWDPSTNSCKSVVPVTPVIPPPGVDTPPGDTPSGGDTPGGDDPGNQGGDNPGNQGDQNQGGQGNQGNQGNPSVAISAEPNRVRSGDTSTISWTLNNVNNCTITKNGTLWKSDISSSGESTPPEIITAQTTYTITCPSISPESVTVNILPVFQEF